MSNLVPTPPMPSCLNVLLPSTHENAEMSAVALRLVEMHGLSAWLQNHLSFDALTPQSQKQVRAQFQSMASMGLRVKRLTHQTLDVLAKWDVTPVLLKGYGLASRIYREPMLRPMSDVDVWVSQAQVSRARQALEGLGLSQQIESDSYYPEEFRQHFVYAGKPGMVELHYRLLSSLGKSWEGTEAYRRAIDGTLDGRRVKYMRPEDELVYLALHAANHFFHRLSWLYDVKLFIDASPQLNWDDVLHVAKEEAKLLELLFYALELSQRVFGAQVPMYVMESLKPSIFRVFSFRQIFSDARLLRADKRFWGVKKFLLANQRDKVLRMGFRRARWAWEKKKAARQ